MNIPCEVLTYDIHDKSWYKDLIEMGIDVRIKNVFLENYTVVENEVIDFIKSEGTTVVLCDGGDKIREFNILSNYLKSGDFILAHDYAENSEIFKEQIYLKIWNWHEIKDSDIKDASDRNELEIYNKDEFDSVVWTCRVKK